ncbi:hypothetical protein AGRA3207_005832 [Actinomadura graeca]|uniref:Protein kinase domain-containing protein n=1 Tax=Actinomadura graeca TaxID=2750812 RepID=A0ABX8R0G6_9ACTN|nr:hypothetical protein [Actinomadura graeca]QXJ24497.1 hypothetical protein AGRA3207_005832 [Actinomadura graeca]
MQSPAAQSPAAPPAYEPLRPGDPALIGGYRVLARLRGGRAYLATTQSGRRLAITRLPSRLADDAALRDRLRARITAARRVRGPYLTAVFDGHADETGAWAATDHVPGPTLERAVAETGPLPVAAVRTLVAALAAAIRAVHDAGLAHGGLAAHTVHLTEDGPRVSALGWAGAGAEPVPSGDVLLLGGVAHFAATGRSPFRDGTHDLTGCPDELRGLVGRCLADDPDDRPGPGAVLTAAGGAPPAPGWLPPDVAALLPAYLAEPPSRPVASGGERRRPVVLPPDAPPPAWQGPMPGAAGRGPAAPVTLPDAPRPAR